LFEEWQRDGRRRTGRATAAMVLGIISIPTMLAIGIVVAAIIASSN
jgi:hypothetical protein